MYNGAISKRVAGLSTSTTACYIATFFGVYAIQYGWIGASVAFHPLGFGLPIATDPHHAILAMYAHSSPSHLLTNTALIAVCGVIFEQQVTTRQYHLFFLSVAIAAALSELTLHCGPGCVNVVGASGGIFGMLGYNVGSFGAIQSQLNRLRSRVVVTVVLAGVIAAIIMWLTARPGGAPVAHGSATFFGFVFGQYNLLPTLNYTIPSELKQVSPIQTLPFQDSE